VNREFFEVEVGDIDSAVGCGESLVVKLVEVREEQDWGYASRVAGSVFSFTFDAGVEAS
jgi:hypothetical protein